MEEDFENMKKKYRNGEVNIDPSVARQFLSEIQYKPLIIMYVFIYLLLIVCCIYSFTVLKWFGILYVSIFLLTQFSLIGIYSMPNSKTNMPIIGITCIIFSMFVFNNNVTILITLSFIDMYLNYYLYKFVSKVMMEKFILKDLRWYEMFQSYIYQNKI